ncbi:MAG: hypothetical protein CMN73_06570 [Sphingomonas sp.]|nr:hypothetical protein [Sphingomonas sp.]
MRRAYRRKAPAPSRCVRSIAEEFGFGTDAPPLRLRGADVQAGGMTSLALEAETAAGARLLSDGGAARRLFRPIADACEELAVFAYLDTDGILLGMRHTLGESRDSCAIPVRDVAADALAFGARAVVMAHNHPSGDPTPSRADREATNGLARALGPLDIRLVDHLVLARGDAVSFRVLGWL